MTNRTRPFSGLSLFRMLLTQIEVARRDLAEGRAHGAAMALEAALCAWEAETGTRFDGTSLVPIGPSDAREERPLRLIKGERTE